MKKFFFLLCIYLTVISANAQISTYLEKGKSGFGINAGYEITKGYDGIFGKLSYSLNGKFDLTLSAFQSYYNENEEDLLNDNASDLYFGLEASWWMIREKMTSDIDFNLALCAGFQTDEFNNYEYVSGYYGNSGLNFWTGTYNGYSGGLLGFNLNLRFNLPENWSVQPMFMTYFGMGMENYTIKGETKETLYHGVSSWFGASVVKRIPGGNSLMLTLLDEISSYNDSHTFDIGLAYVFSFGK